VKPVAVLLCGVQFMVVVADYVLVNIKTFPRHVCHSGVCLFNRCYVFRSFVFYCRVESLVVRHVCWQSCFRLSFSNWLLWLQCTVFNHTAGSCLFHWICLEVILFYGCCHKKIF